MSLFRFVFPPLTCFQIRQVNYVRDSRFFQNARANYRVCPSTMEAGGVYGNNYLCRVFNNRTTYINVCVIRGNTVSASEDINANVVTVAQVSMSQWTLPIPGYMTYVATFSHSVRIIPIIRRAPLRFKRLHSIWLFSVQLNLRGPRRVGGAVRCTRILPNYGGNAKHSICLRNFSRRSFVTRTKCFINCHVSAK